MERLALNYEARESRDRLPELKQSRPSVQCAQTQQVPYEVSMRFWPI
jgi:hypothetical protein